MSKIDKVGFSTKIQVPVDTKVEVELSTIELLIKLCESLDLIIPAALYSESYSIEKFYNEDNKLVNYLCEFDNGVVNKIPISDYKAKEYTLIKELYNVVYNHEEKIKEREEEIE